MNRPRVVILILFIAVLAFSAAAQQQPSSSDPAFAPSSLAQWAGALATTAAVLVALFKDEYLRRRRRPRLTATILPKPPNCLLVPNARVYGPNGLIWSGKIYYLRLWIENTGIGRAEQVQVFASRLWKEGADSIFALVKEFEPMNLRWSNGSDPARPEIFAAGLSRGFGKHCDLCSVSDPANPTDQMQGYEEQCVGTLQLEVALGGDRNRLPPGKYVVRVSVGAANARPLTVHAEINIRGPWSPVQETMFRDYLGIRILSTLPSGMTLEEK